MRTLLGISLAASLLAGCATTQVTNRSAQYVPKQEALLAEPSFENQKQTTKLPKEFLAEEQLSPYLREYEFESQDVRERAYHVARRLAYKVEGEALCEDHSNNSIIVNARSFRPAEERIPEMLVSIDSQNGTTLPNRFISKAEVHGAQKRLEQLVCGPHAKQPSFVISEQATKLFKELADGPVKYQFESQEVEKRAKDMAWKLAYSLEGRALCLLIATSLEGEELYLNGWVGFHPVTDRAFESRFPEMLSVIDSQNGSVHPDQSISDAEVEGAERYLWQLVCGDFIAYAGK